MTPLAEVHRIAAVYDVTVIPCAAPFPARYYSKGDLLFVSPDVTLADINALESYLPGMRPKPVLRLVGAVDSR